MDIYFDNAATSHPKPETVLSAVLRALTKENANPGRAGHGRAILAAERVLKAREAVSDILDTTDPFEIVFTMNCTDALNLAIKGSVRRGDHVIASVLEHNSVLRILGEKMKSGDIEASFVSPSPDGFIDPAAYARLIRKNTSLMILTHAANTTGAVQPVKAVATIGRLHGIRTLIDGAQAAGETEVSVRSIGCDLYAFPGHKSLLGPQGTGGLYIKNGVRLETLREGGTGSSSDSIHQPEELPERYEAGTVNLPGLAGLEAGCRYVKENLSAIRKNVLSITQMIYEELSALKGCVVYSPESMLRRTGIVLFNLNDFSSAETAQQLSDAGFCVRAGLHCAPFAHRFLKTEKRGAVRISCGWKNTLQEAEELIRAIHALSKK